ncbi:kinase-like domain-containing protein [Glomus cerebriforme]|uniref:Kinase-like domain-containing protein n=1 Tax=Glomus cerebriforme TaxID=658196 RepID=A0A397T6S9_9GLOM|nr:kinase-like domain-containing protein [Glomus cerebriforme]
MSICKECSESIDTTTRWCTPCNANHFEENFPMWTSDSPEMDKFIRETQITAKRQETVIEWVSPSKFTRHKKVEFSKNNIAYWEDGYLLAWNAEKNEWDRKGGQWVKLVSHYCEKYLTSHFLKSERDFSETNPLERLVYGMTRDPETNDYAVIERLEEECPLCKREWMSPRWCRGCYSDHFESEFNNWTSGNTHIDIFIRETQTIAEFPEQVLEWIPESHLTELTQIGQGGYGTVFKAYWNKGRIYKRDFIANKWKRSKPIWVALKNIEEEEEGSTAAFLKEAKAMNKCIKTDMYFLDFYGISRHPVTKKYLIVMRYVEEGDLRKYLFSNFANNSWINRINRLWGLATDLRTLHLSDLVHKDLHSGNVLFGNDRRSFIADFGLACRDGQSQENDAKGVLPYVAPEVLCRKPYTKAADVYSFGIIMWEFTSYQPPFCTRAYDIDLALEIHAGLRPPVIKGTPECYIRLMKQCWDSNPANRPTAHSLADTLEKWYQILSEKYESKYFTYDEDIRNQFNCAEQERQRNPFSIKPVKSHPLAILTSRLLPTVLLPTVIEERTITEGYQTLQYEFTVDETNINEDADHN